MRACLILAALSLAGPAAAPRTGGAVLRVPGDHPTIQAAIDAAAPGDTVLVARGTYEGPFTLGKTLTLASAFPATGDPADASGTILRGGSPILTVKSSAGPGTTIAGLTFHRGAKAVVLDRARRVDVLDCRFIDNGGDQLSFEGAGGTVRNCRFQNAGDDNIDIDNDSDPLVEHNTLIGAADDNIEMRCQPYVKPALLTAVIRRNFISGAKSGDGIQLIDYKGASNRVIRIERNVITGAKWAGIGSMEDGHTKQTDFPDAPHGSPQVEKVYVLHNTIVGNRFGVTGGRNMLLLNNIIADSAGAALRRVLGASEIRNTCLSGNGADADDCVTLQGTVAAPPQFDAGHRLKQGSRCVDAGAASVVWNGETVAAGPFAGAAPDLGAFESGRDALPAPESEKVEKAAAPDSKLPVVSVEATVATASEKGSKPGVFTLTRTGSTAAPLLVAFTLGGEAVNGVDYARVEGAVTIPAGEASVRVTIVPVDDSAADEDEVTLVLAESRAYALGSASGATITIDDND